MTVTVSWKTDDPTRVPQILGFGTASLVLGLASVITRFAIRVKKCRGGLWWDDWFILVGMIFVIGNYSLVILETRYGLGRHVKDLPKGLDMSMPIKMFFAIQQTYIWGWGFVKMAMCFFLLRLFASWRKPIYCFMAFMTAFTVSVGVAGFFTCIPLSHWWDPSVPGRCIDVPLYAKSLGIVNILTDVFLYVLPMRTVWKLNLPRRKRVSVVALFAVGFLVVVMGFLRMRSLSGLARTADQTWDKVPPHLWSLGELNIAIFVTSAPSFKPIYNTILGLRSKGSSAYGSGGTGGAANSHQSGECSWRQKLARRQHGYAGESIDLQCHRSSTADLTLTDSQKASIINTTAISPIDLESAERVSDIENDTTLAGRRAEYGIAMASPAAYRPTGNY